MELTLEKLSKKYEGNWIFRNVNLSVPAHSKILITGKNGSGKSTLAKAIAGLILPSEGTITYKKNGIVVSSEQAYREIQLLGPYIDLVEDFTIQEFLTFHHRFKPLSLSIKELLELGYFEAHKDKYIRNFSSGMKQRLKLLISFLSSTSLVIVDEPTANLDDKTIEWYHELVRKYSAEKTIMVCSNNPSIDAAFCTSVLNIEDFISQ